MTLGEKERQTDKQTNKQTDIKKDYNNKKEWNKRGCLT